MSEEPNEVIHEKLHRKHLPTRTWTVNKEVPLYWLITMFIGGIANFACFIWIAATVVSDGNNLKKLVEKHESQLNEKDKLENFTRISIERISEVIKAMDLRLVRHELILDRHDDRINKTEDRRR